MRDRLNIVLTGATAGIGLECARTLCADGHTVVGIARSEDTLARLACELPSFRWIACDLSDEQNLEGLGNRLDALLDGGAVDVLINNAGYGAAGPVEQVPLSEWKAQFDLNVFGTIAVTQAVLPLLRRSERGRIVNVSSVAGNVYAPFFAPYYSSKHALNCVSDTLRLELRRDGIDVVRIEPGAVKTGFANNEDEMLRRWAAESDRYRGAIGRVIDWHEGLVEEGIEPGRVVQTISKAVRAKRPKHRYLVPVFPSIVFIAIVRFLPSRLADAIVRRLTKVDG